MNRTLSIALAWIAGALIASPASPGLAAETVIELNGICLLQSIDVVKELYGKPLQEDASADKPYRAYPIDKEAYLIAWTDKKDPNWIGALQITGTTVKTLPFKGLMLGDPEAKVLRTLGKPDEVLRVHGDLILWSWTDRNYSVELTDNHTLHSVKIGMVGALLAFPEKDDSSWEEFRDAIIRKDVTRLAARIRPDVEVYDGRRYYQITRRCSEYSQDPDFRIFQFMFQAAGELASKQATREFRLREGQPPGMVYKFYDSKVLKEVVFLPYAGRWRVYEFTYR